ncbi:DUF2946 family protein [Amaricoccus solimangrovi]|uniref:DUF2946 domain-containing protein n=1 Tax=Amaricoccus solimangrovi TaxID=2589815 RepID=A0A501WIL5_9RHOB|nr:DUF2946 family protein [Amaricoccus solimangrovi]TPE46987.1 hypothetical protein FJM51_20825 [Amaricoccus solimangrovi]
MSGPLIRRALLVLTILGLLMPRVSGVVASAVPGMVTIVICTGQGLTTIRFGDAGKPVPVIDHPDHCLFAHATDTATRAEVAAPLARVVDATPRAGGALIRASGTTAPRPPPRAPPLV